jgi:hypothetical protein
MTDDAFGPLFSYRDGGPGFQSRSETSREAAGSVESNTATLRRMVYNAVLRSMPDGRTCDELQVELNMLAQTCSARCTELKRVGSLYEARIEGKLLKRPTRSGRNAAVLYASPVPAIE